MQVDVAVAVAHVELDRHPRSAAHQMRNRCSTASASRPGTPAGVSSQCGRGHRDLGLRRPVRVQVQANPVGRDRLDPGRVPGPVGQLGPERGRELAHGGHLTLAARAHGLGHLLQPDDLACPRAGQVGQLGRGGQRLRLEPGVDVQRVQPGGPQEPAADLFPPQRGPRARYSSGAGVRGQPEQRRAPAPQGQAGWVPNIVTQGPGAVRLGQQRLELRAVRAAAEHPVAVVVGQPQFRDRREHSSSGTRGPVTSAAEPPAAAASVRRCPPGRSGRSRAAGPNRAPRTPRPARRTSQIPAGHREPVRARPGRRIGDHVAVHRVPEHHQSRQRDDDLPHRHRHLAPEEHQEDAPTVASTYATSRISVPIVPDHAKLSSSARPERGRYMT